MEHNDFAIGGEFYCDANVWRCTDIGSRVITAICLDRVAVINEFGARILSRDIATLEGWFSGPPYAIPEIVFDEDDIKNCWVENDKK